MKDDMNMKLTIRAQRLLAKHESNPERIIKRLLADIDCLNDRLNRLHPIVRAQPIPHTHEKNMILELAIKGASRQMHTAFQLCHVPNAILTTVTFPDGNYRLTFRRESKYELKIVK